MSEDVKVVEILPDEDTAITKFGPGSYYKGFGYSVVLKLEDGREVHMSQHNRLLRDAKAELAALPKVPEYETFAMFQGGQFVGTEVHYWVGGGR